MFEDLFDKVMGGPERRARVEEISSTISIPSQPKVMSEINAEFSKKDVNFGIVGELVSRDVGLSAKLLKVANSPLFAPKVKVESIDQALMMLGAKQFKQTIFASAFRQAMESKLQVNEDFWSHSEGVGLVCEFIAREWAPEFGEHAYMTGLFHDCAVPILMERGEGYKQLVVRCLGRDRDVFKDEEQECEIEHGSLGLVMTRSWSIPIPIVRVVRAHHSDNFAEHNDTEAVKLHAILAIAENFYLYSRQGEDEIFGPNKNSALFTNINEATGWNEKTVLGLTEGLCRKYYPAGLAK